VNDQVTWKLIAGVLVIKTIVWVVALGSETAGGILAPLLMIGGAMGAAIGHSMTPISPGAWAVIGMTSVIAASLGAPLTAAMFAVELTHNGGLMLPVLLACVTAYAIGVLLQPRSMLTGGLSRKGLHLSREYGVDPLETVMVGDVMHTSVFALPWKVTRQAAVDWLETMNQRGGEAWSHWQRLFPLVDDEGNLRGVLSRGNMIAAAGSGDAGDELLNYGTTAPAVVGPRDTLRHAAEKMAGSKLRSFPVVDPHGLLVGILNIEDLLEARGKESLRNSERQRVLRLRWPFGRSQRNEEGIGELVDKAFDAAKREQALSEEAEENGVEPR
jgi:CIC family chloride channel protein